MVTRFRKILVVGNYRPQRQFSIQVYFDHLLEMARLSGFGEVIGVSPPVRFGRVPFLSNSTANWLDRFLIGPLSFPRADIVLVADHANAIYLPFLRAELKVVVCHDLIPFHYRAGTLKGWHPSWLGSRYLDAIAGGLRRADHIVCVSEQTRRDLEHFIGVAPSCTSVVRFCVRRDLPNPSAHQQSEALRHLSLPMSVPMVMSFGDSPYKNRLGTLHMFERALPALSPDTVLVSIGAVDSRYSYAVNRSPAAGRVFVRSNLSDIEIASLYKASSALLFPSNYEGFGMPILEAQYLRLPVITSRVASIPEVVGDGGIVIEPDDIDAGARALVSLMTDPVASDAIRAKGWHNVSMHRFEHWVEAWHGVWDSIGVVPAP